MSIEAMLHPAGIYFPFHNFGDASPLQSYTVASSARVAAFDLI
jgi:hypothetical protein